MRAIKITQNNTFNSVKPKSKTYPVAPVGCKSLEEFSDALEKAILEKL